MLGWLTFRWIFLLLFLPLAFFWLVWGFLGFFVVVGLLFSGGFGFFFCLFFWGGFFVWFFFFFFFCGRNGKEEGIEVLESQRRR